MARSLHSSVQLLYSVIKAIVLCLSRCRCHPRIFKSLLAWWTTFHLSAQAWAPKWSPWECLARTRFPSSGQKYRNKPLTKQNTWLHQPQSYFIILHTDVSDYAIDGALLQPSKKGKLQPVTFTSSSMNSAEQRYSQIEKESHTFQMFDQCLYGKSDIAVRTDHQPLEIIINKPLKKVPFLRLNWSRTPWEHTYYNCGRETKNRFRTIWCPDSMPHRQWPTVR